ncbi:hypothetical protein JCM10207_006025 [Rhodosporidiobolus poonsookiae]
MSTATSDSPPEQDKKKTRNRKASSCNPCRARRVRCDRGHPCSACVARKDEAGCVWDKDALKPLYERREANETERLRNEVDRLQRLVDVLVSVHKQPELAADPSASVSLPFPPPPYPASSQGLAPAPLSLARVPPFTSSPEESRGRQLPEEQDITDLDSQDLVRKLGELTLKTFEFGGDAVNVHDDSLVNEAKYLLDVAAPGPAVSSNAHTALLLPTQVVPTTVAELLARVPPKATVDKAAEGYYTSLAWYLHPVTKDQYRKHEDAIFAAVQTPGQSVSPFALALCFAIWGLGLFTYPADPSKSDGEYEPVYASYDLHLLVASLIELSRTALAVGRFLESPTLDGIRAVLLLATHYAVLAPGDDGGAGIGLLALDAQACLQLELHHDPDKRFSHLSFGEKEDRRRLWWMCFLKDAEIASVMGRRFTLLHARDCNVKVPLDLHDHQLREDNPQVTGEETYMTALLARFEFSKLVDQITDEVFGVKPVSYSRVLEFDRQIFTLQAKIPEMYKLSTLGGSADIGTTSKALILDLALRQEVLRLHRPWLARAFSNPKYAYSRAVCVKTAREVLQLQMSPLLRSSWACMNFKAVTASVVLLLELMYDPDVAEAQQHQELVKEAIKRLEKFSKISTICRRGIVLLRFLLDKIDRVARSYRLDLDSAPRSKRSRSSLPGSGSSSSANMLGEPFSLDPLASSTHDAEADDELKHKTLRSSFASASTRSRHGSFGSAMSVASTRSSGSTAMSSVAPSPLFSFGTAGGGGVGSSSRLFAPAPASSPSASMRSRRASTSSGASVGLATGAPATSSPGTMRSAADEIASLDFPALLGIDGHAPPFSFDFSSGGGEFVSGASVCSSSSSSSLAAAASMPPPSSGMLDLSLPLLSAPFTSSYADASTPAAAPAHMAAEPPPNLHDGDAWLHLLGGGVGGPDTAKTVAEGTGGAPAVDLGLGGGAGPVGTWDDGEWAEWLRRM